MIRRVYLFALIYRLIPVLSSKKVSVVVSAISSVSLKLHYTHLWLLFLLLNALNDKSAKILHGRHEPRWECFHLSLWRCLSSRPCDSPCTSRSLLFLSPLDSFYSRSLATSATWRKLQLWPRARGDISSFSSSISPSMLFRRSSRTCCHFIDPPSELRHIS